MKIVAGLFVLVHAMAALAMAALSVHGPSGLVAGAGVYFSAAVALVLWASARRSWRFLLTAGVFMLAAPPAVFVFLDQLERGRNEQRVAATRVSEVQDEPILSVAGRPIGMRLSFAVSVPESGSFAISPAVHGAEGLYMNPMQRTLDGRADSWQYEAGRVHRQSAELYPPILMRAPDGALCLSHFVPTLPSGREAVPLRIVIHETPFAGRTQRVYDLPQLYRNVIAEKLPPCSARSG
jgi:hypothetical protein